jgi:hypothetical protein
MLHKNFFLSKEVSGSHELCWHLWNNQLSHDHLFFHDTCLLTLFLILIPSSFASTINLRSATLEHLYEFSLSSISRCLLFSSALPSLGFLPFLLVFHDLLFPCVHWNLSLHYRFWYPSHRPPFHDWRLPCLLPFPQYTS